MYFLSCVEIKTIIIINIIIIIIIIPSPSICLFPYYQLFASNSR